MDKPVDTVDNATAPAEPTTTAVEQTVVTITATGRTVVVMYPVDLSDSELVELAGWICTNLRGHIAQLKLGRSRIIVPGRLI